MSQILEHFRLVTGLPEISGGRRVHTPKSFASVLTRERDRTDRTGLEFSLVVFDSGSHGRRAVSRRLLVSRIASRIRTTDDAGCLKDGRIGVVLPHTTPGHALKFVHNVLREFVDESLKPNYTIYSYPTAWISGIDTDPPEVAQSGNPTDGPGNRTSSILGGLPAWKRAIDIAGSIFALIFLSPLLLLVALLIKFVSPGPLFFRQERVGLFGKTFTLWKFRTMHVQADTTVHQNYLRELINNEQSMTKLDNKEDPRIIPFGVVLRKTGIDELPQLINILRGEMSLVGPRPCVPYEAREYQPWQKRRFDTTPGLTGLWQVNGKNRTTFKEMVRLDIAYTKKLAFGLDAVIFLKTIPAIIEQVTEKPVFALSRSRVYSAVSRTIASLAVFISFLTMNRFHK